MTTRGRRVQRLEAVAVRAQHRKAMRVAWMMIALVAFALAVGIAFRKDPRDWGRGAVAATTAAESAKSAARQGVSSMVEAPGEMQEKYAWSLPRNIAFDQEITAVAASAVPVVGESSLAMALRNIARAGGQPELQTDDDKEIIELARKYATGEVVFNVSYGQPGSSAGFSRMAYSCEADHFLVAPGLRARIGLLGVSLYHELYHKLECQRMGPNPRKVPPEQDCAGELPAYAAQVRFLLLLVRTKQVPAEVSDDGGDMGLLQQSFDVYNALVQRRFCSWLGNARASRGHHTEGHFMQKLP